MKALGKQAKIEEIIALLYLIIAILMMHDSPHSILGFVVWVGGAFRLGRAIYLYWKLPA